MTELIAIPVIKNKFWIVEDGEHQVATIQAIEEGGFAFVHENERVKFPTIKMLKSNLNIEFVNSRPPAKKDPAAEVYEVYGWPTAVRPHNNLYDVSRRLPIYTKTSKSKSYFCAGYYIVKYSSSWTKEYCPKLITLQRYEFAGPYHTKEQMQEQLRIANGE